MYSQHGPSQFTTIQGRRLNTENVDGNTGNALDGNQQAKLTTNYFVGDNAECDKVDLGAVFTQTCTHKKDQVVTKRNATALKNTHSVAGSTASITSGYDTVTCTNFSLHACNGMDSSTCTVKSTHINNDTTNSKPVATTGLSKLEKSKRKEEPVVYAAPSKPQFYNKYTYTVLIRDNVRVVNTKVYSSLPLHSKYMVKERVPGTNKVKLAMKSCYERFVIAIIICNYILYA